ncbi:unnamed protein product, partial [Rotaria sp. Silwood1]
EVAPPVRFIPDAIQDPQI